MNPYPLVSIVTPSFNSSRFIVETIESVQSQDHPNIEHIVIDGNSNGGTVEILKRYPQLQWVSEADSGIEWKCLVYNFYGAVWAQFGLAQKIQER